MEGEENLPALVMAPLSVVTVQTIRILERWQTLVVALPNRRRVPHETRPPRPIKRRAISQAFEKPSSSTPPLAGLVKAATR